jgi:hypothetical protein
LGITTAQAQRNEESASASNYKNVRIFEPLEEQFYSLLETEAGGFAVAAHTYAEVYEIP